jgi:hypothetical protein
VILPGRLLRASLAAASLALGSGACSGAADPAPPSPAADPAPADRARMPPDRAAVDLRLADAAEHARAGRWAEAVRAYREVIADPDAPLAARRAARVSLVATWLSRETSRRAGPTCVDASAGGRGDGPVPDAIAARDAARHELDCAAALHDRGDVTHLRRRIDGLDDADRRRCAARGERALADAYAGTDAPPEDERACDPEWEPESALDRSLAAGGAEPRDVDGR